MRSAERAVAAGATLIRTVPVSFWTRMMRMGNSATSNASRTSRSRGSLSTSRFSDSSTAIIKMTATFANSDGCSVMPPGRSIHARAPAMVAPIPGTNGSRSRNTDAP